VTFGKVGVVKGADYLRYVQMMAIERHLCDFDEC
jgi:hypothetical protein